MRDETPCPDPQALRRLVLGQVQDADAVPLEEHLAGCARCGELAERFHADDALVSAMRAGSPLLGGPDWPAVGRLIERLRGLRVAEGHTPEPTIEVSPRADTPAAPDPEATQAGYDFLAPAQGPDEMGRLGPYHVLKALGQGGMGVVFEAHDPHLQRRVALKALRGGRVDQPGARERFLREARAGAALHSDHVVTVYQVGEDRGTPFLAMELLPGESLECRLQREGRLPVAEALRLAREVAAGLAAAHDRGLTHRDVKPSNVWLEERSGGPGSQPPPPRAKVLDFGLARPAREDQHLTQEGLIVGTPPYIAPEQAQGEAVDGRADLFGLGVVLYRMCTGELPFQGRNNVAILLAVAADPPRPPRDLEPDLPPPVNDLILRLLAKKPDERPASAREVIAAIEAIEREEREAVEREAVETVVQPPAPVDRPAPVAPAPARRRPPRALAAAVQLAALGGLGYLLGPTVVRIATNKGELVVEVDDPRIEVVIRGDGVLLHDRTAKREFVLTAGDGEIEVFERDGVRLMTKKFTLTRGGKTTVTVTQRELAEAKKPKPPDRTAPGDHGTVGPVTPPVLPPDKEKPFVLLRDDKPAGEFKTLHGALNEQKTGDAIEVHGNGPFKVGKIDLKGKGLTLRAAPGYRPRFEPGETVVNDGYWFNMTDAPLVLEGCDFVCLRPAARIQFLAGGGAPWEIRNCRILNAHQAVSYDGPKLTISDCQIHSAWGGHLQHTELHLTNNVLLCYWSLSFAGAGGQTVQAHKNTFHFVGTSGHGIDGLFDVRENAGTVSITATENLFHYARPFPLVVIRGKEWKDRVRWRGRDNLYVNVNAAVCWAKDFHNLEGYKGWPEFLKEKGNQEEGARKATRLVFQHDPVALESPEAVVAMLRRETETVRRQKGLSVLGPDWDLVGAGDAYVRALAAAGKPVPRDQLRPEAEEGGPFVLIRAGKVVRGYESLAAAGAQVADGDTIEIRTDGPIPEFGLDRDHGRLTIRAAPGYRPVMDGSIYSAKGELTIEGIHCRKGRMSCRVARLANCSFSWAEAHHDQAFFESKDGKPAEIVNCLVLPAGLQPAMPAGGKVVVRNSVISSVQWRWGPPGPHQVGDAHLELDRSVIWSPVMGNFLMGVFFIENKGKVTLELNRTLIDSGNPVLRNHHLVKGILGGEDLRSKPMDTSSVQWLGTGNAYRMSTAFALDDWRKHFTSPEEGSVLADALIWDARQWRLLPGQADLPDGKHYGADVDRVAATPAARPSAAPAPVPDKERPFVLLRDGKPVRAFKSLGGALNDQRPGDVIEVHGNGPFNLAGLEQVEKWLKLRAAPGYRPWFIVPQLIKATDATIDIEGCDFDTRDALRFFEGTGPSWEFRRCRLWGGNLNFYGRRVRLADCLLVGGRDFLGVHSDCRVEIDNCLSCVPGTLVTVGGANGTVRLKDSTFVFAGFGGACAVQLWDNVTEARVEASGNLFVWAVSHHSGPLAGKDWQKRVRWQGRDNLYAGGFSWENKPGERVGGLAEWNKLWAKPEEGSREAPELALEWSRPNGLDGAGTRAYYEPAVAAAKRRYNLPELGPDWDLIGPGDTYLKALEQAAGKPIPKERLRADVPDDKPFVILRGGKDAASYHTLQEAVDAAQDRDVIELRTDFKSAGATCNGKGRLLTLRAGPGYLPVLRNLGSGGEDRLVVEGITFLGDVSGGPWGGYEKGYGGSGGIVRLANCSVPGHCGGWFRGPGGQPAEVSNCWIGHLHAGLQESPLRLTNSVLRSLSLDPRAEKPSRLETDRCVLANPEPGYPFFSNLQSAGQRQGVALAVSVKRSFVRSPVELVHADNVDFTWKGSGNVYSVPQGYWHGLYTPSLAAWRAKFKSDGDSFEEVPPHLDPVQWRIRTDSPGYVKRQDGRDFGADVGRIGAVISVK